MIPRFHSQATRLQTATPAPGGSAGGMPSVNFGDALPVIIGAVVLVAIIALGFAVAYKFRRRRRRHESGAQPSAPKAAAGPPPAHRQRRQQRPRNPTLGETSGLPPVRDTNPPSPAG